LILGAIESKVIDFGPLRLLFPETDPPLAGDTVISFDRDSESDTTC